MSKPDEAIVEEADVLEPVGRGAQGDVFGTERWVVKVRRISFLGLLAKCVSRWDWLEEVRGALGGLVAPYFLLEGVAFRAPKMNGRGRIVEYREKVALAQERFFVGDFLDHQLSLAEPREALALVREMVVLVEGVRARGYYMHDFIMRNFVLLDGRLMIADAGLITPLRAFWEPTMRACAWGFQKGLSKDYQRLLGEVRDEVEGDEVLREEIAQFSAALPARLGRLRRRSVPGLVMEAPLPIGFEADLEKEIRTALGSVR